MTHLEKKRGMLYINEDNKKTERPEKKRGVATGFVPGLLFNLRS